MGVAGGDGGGLVGRVVLGSPVASRAAALGVGLEAAGAATEPAEREPKRLALRKRNRLPLGVLGVLGVLRGECFERLKCWECSPAGVALVVRAAWPSASWARPGRGRDVTRT
mmetsp:Transcript_28909/g.67788  ORF Transcript_28909/g.67788 Transcript_28909/m.67788 type:complete len:112 (+) Transcript_28909:585-920(+)